MYQEQRLEKILELLEERKQLSAKEMVDYFKVSKDTIRRDFAPVSYTHLICSCCAIHGLVDWLWSEEDHFRG